MVDIFKKEICNYCKNTECEKNKLVEVEIDGVKTYKCFDYKRKLSKISSKESTLTIKKNNTRNFCKNKR